MMHVLILDRFEFAEALKKSLEPNFPELQVEICSEEEAAWDLIKDIDVLLASRISDRLLQRATRLQWIQVKTTGVEKIVALPSLRKEVLITSTRGIHVPQMSEMAILLMLALNRNFKKHILNQEKRIWEPWPGRLLFQKKVGILGVGVIGEGIARRCKAFSMTVYGMDIVKRTVDGVDFFLGPEAMDEMIPQLDYLVIAAPLTPDTRNMINAHVLSKMKLTAFLINLGRGEIIDEGALIEALMGGRIAGAALDVFSDEPLPAEHPLWAMENVIITPHVGGRSEFGVKQLLSVFEENLRRFLRGEKENLINLVRR